MALVMEIVKTKVLVSTILVTDSCQLLVLKKAGLLVAQLEECTGPSVLGEFATTVLQHLHLARLSAFKQEFKTREYCAPYLPHTHTHTHTHMHTHTCTHIHIHIRHTYTSHTSHILPHTHTHTYTYITHLTTHTYQLCCVAR